MKIARITCIMGVSLQHELRHIAILLINSALIETHDASQSWQHTSVTKISCPATSTDASVVSARCSIGALSGAFA